MPITPIFWCPVRRAGVSTPPVSTHEGAAKAVMSYSTDIWRKSEIQVVFLKKSKANVRKSTLLGKWGLDEETILEWANRWSLEQNTKIPSFVPCTGREKDADIAIELNDQGYVESRIGPVKSDGKPTMWLDFSKGDRNYHEHITVHEFGHSLGLEHEHQRSDFWEKIEPFMDTNKMKEQVGERFKDYEKQKGSGPMITTEYDPESVMHYWFLNEWLKSKYNQEEKIKREREELAISESEEKALLGIHKRDVSKHGLVTEPSPKDLNFLNVKYGQQKSPASSSTLHKKESEPANHDPVRYMKDLLKDEEAKEKIDQLKVQHKNLHQRLRKHLDTNEDVMEGIRVTLASLRDEDDQYQSVYDDLPKECSITGFFDILMCSISYLDFNGLLDELIRNHGSNELQEDAKIYRRKLMEFLGCTTVKQAANPSNPFWPARRKKLPDNFTKVRTCIADNPDSVRLIEVIGLRKTFTSKVRLSHLLYIIMGIEEGNSFMISWLVPSVAVPLLANVIQGVDASFFKVNKIVSVSYMIEKIIYSEKDFEKMKSSSSSFTTPQEVTEMAKLQLKSTSKKHSEFVTSPIEAKGVTALPGIGKKLGENLTNIGVIKAENVLGQFLALGKDEVKFKRWLNESCKADTRRQQQCYQALKGWCEAHI